jgi:hypothetical protein
MILKTSFFTFLGVSLLGIGYSVHTMTRGADSEITDIAFAICLFAYMFGLLLLAFAVMTVVAYFRPKKVQRAVLWSRKPKSYMH